MWTWAQNWAQTDIFEAQRVTEGELVRDRCRLQVIDGLNHWWDWRDCCLHFQSDKRGDKYANIDNLIRWALVAIAMSRGLWNWILKLDIIEGADQIVMSKGARDIISSWLCNVLWTIGGKETASEIGVNYLSATTVMLKSQRVHWSWRTSAMLCELCDERLLQNCNWWPL